MNSDAEIRKAAVEYVEAQLAVMAKYGSTPILSFDEYYRIVKEVAELTKKIRTKYAKGD